MHDSLRFQVIPQPCSFNAGYHATCTVAERSVAANGGGCICALTTALDMTTPSCANPSDIVLYQAPCLPDFLMVAGETSLGPWLSKSELVSRTKLVYIEREKLSA